MATKVKPSRLNVTGTPQVGDVPVYVDADKFQWSGQGKLTAGTGIEIKNGPDYSAMQGPAPTGFHVPLNTERQAVKNIWAAIGDGTGTNFGIALKLPFAGRRGLSSNVSAQGSSGIYWSSSSYDTYQSYVIYFEGPSIQSIGYLSRTYGFSVRCFKDSPVTPTSSWTKLYGTSIEAGGMFWNATDGLISMSSDGTTWITIADKNLGATQVRNNGDTLSEANCGKYYQWGNNYGFPRTGTVTISSIDVDASSYGPGNYYSNDTFRTTPGGWDSSNNGNLWGGVTGVIVTETVISNTGVLSVNGNTGAVTVEEVPSGGTDGQVLSKVSGNIAWANPTGGADIEYVTQAEYTALLPGAASDGKHYFIYISSGGGVLFDFGDWTDSVWTTGPRSGAIQGTITKTATYISFYNSSNNSINYLSQYPIDGTRDFLLEFNGNIPNTSASDHQIGLVDAENSNNILGFYTYYGSNGTMYCYVNSTRYNPASNPGTADYFIRKEGTVLTMGWGGNTIYTNSNFSSTSTYYLYEKVYRDTITINTAKLTYL